MLLQINTKLIHTRARAHTHTHTHTHTHIKINIIPKLCKLHLTAIFDIVCVFFVLL